MGEEGGLCQRDEALSFPKLNDTFSIIKATTSKERGGVGGRAGFEMVILPGKKKNLYWESVVGRVYVAKALYVPLGPAGPWCL